MALGDFFTKKVSKKNRKRGAIQEANPPADSDAVEEAVVEEAGRWLEVAEAQTPGAYKAEGSVAGEPTEEVIGIESAEEAEGEAEEQAEDEEEEAVEEPGTADAGGGPEPAWGREACRPPALSREQLQRHGPRMDFAVNSRDSVEIHGLSHESSEVALLVTFPPVQGAEGFAWSPDGQWLGLLGQRSLQIVEAFGGKYEPFCELWPLGGEARPLKAFHFSPLGTFATCFEPFARGDAQVDPEPNLAVWRLEHQPVLVGSFAHERRNECGWPALKWTEDESRCCRLARDEIQIFPGDRPDLEEKDGAIACEGVTAFELSCGQPVYAALFVPQRKGERARCLVYSLEDASVPSAMQELTQADSVSMRWNHAGTAVLLLTSTDVDGTGKSYYGKTGLHLLHADGKRSLAVVSPKAGPVHDVVWSPSQDEFLLLHGDLPCGITLHDGQQAKKVLDFGKAHRNNIQWNAAGTFFTLGGFGQLAGDLDFWDRPSGEKLGQTRYECCVDCQWSADGRHLLGWTTFPRMRVDNRLELFDYAGSRLFRRGYDELYSVVWRPMPAGSYPDRPPTPTRSRMGSMQMDRDTPKMTAYRAPMSSGALAASLRAMGESGERTRAKTAGEQAAEAVEARAKRQADKDQKPMQKELSNGTKLQLGMAQRRGRNAREVPVPEELVARLIGLQGTTIQELTRQAGLALKVRQASDGSGGQVVVIGPPRNEDEAATVQKAEELVLAKLAELRDSSKDFRHDGRPEPTEMAVPVDLIGGLIGHKGATIEELSREAGIQLRVPKRRSSDDVAGKVLIGPGDPEAIAHATELIQAKLDNLQAGGKARSERNGDRWATKGWWDHKGWENDAGREGEPAWSEDQGWTEERGWKEQHAWAEDRAWAADRRGWSDSKGLREEDAWAEDSAWADGVCWADPWPQDGERGERGWWSVRGHGESRAEEGREGGKGGRGQKWRGERSARWEELTEQSPGALPSSPSGSSRPLDSRAGRLPQEQPTAGSAQGAAGARAASPSSSRGEKSDKQEMDMMRQKGESALQSGDFRGAVEAFTKALRLQPRDFRSLCGRSEAQLQTGEAHEAFMSASNAVRLQPESALGHLRKGLAQKATGQEDKAVASLREALRLDPGCKEAQAALGLAPRPESERAPTGAGAPPGSAGHEEERAFHCAECGDAAEFGAIDPADRQWYCKACWESLVTEEPGAQASAKAPPDACEEAAQLGASAVREAASESILPGTGEPRRRWADEPVQDDGLEEPRGLLERRRGLDRGPAVAWAGPSAPGPRAERHLGTDWPPNRGSAGPKASVGTRDNRDRRHGAERAGGKGGPSFARTAAAPRAMETPASAPATISMPRNPFGAARPS